MEWATRRSFVYARGLHIFHLFSMPRMEIKKWKRRKFMIFFLPATSLVLWLKWCGVVVTDLRDSFPSIPFHLREVRGTRRKLPAVSLLLLFFFLLLESFSVGAFISDVFWIAADACFVAA